MKSPILTTVYASLLAATFTPLAARAAQVPVVNPSFETTIVSDGVHSTTIPGWNIVSGNTTVPITGVALTDAVTTYNPIVANYAGATGNNSAPGMVGSNVLDLSGGLVGLTGVVTQQLASAPITLGYTYTLTVSVGDPANFAYHGYTVAVGTTLAGGTGLTLLSLATGNIGTSGTFGDISISYTPNVLDPLIGSIVGTNLTIELASNSLATVGASSVDFDNVRLDVSPTGAVPEPSTWTLAFAGAGLLGALNKFRRERRS